MDSKTGLKVYGFSDFCFRLLKIINQAYDWVGNPVEKYSQYYGYHHTNTVRQGIFEVIKFCGSPKTALICNIRGIKCRVLYSALQQTMQISWNKFLWFSL